MGQKLLKIGSAAHKSYPMDQNFVEITLSSTVFEIQAFLCFAFLKKIQNGRYFWQVKYLLRLGKASHHRYPVAQKFCRNHSISHSFRDTSIFVFCNFCEKVKIQNGCHFWWDKKILKTRPPTQQSYSMGQKFR